MYQFLMLLWQMIIEFFFPTYFEEDASDEGTGEIPDVDESDELPTDAPASDEADVPVISTDETPVAEDDIVTYPAAAPVAGEDDETVTSIEIKE